MIIQHFEMNEEDSHCKDYDDLVNVHLRGNNLTAFKNDWDLVVQGLNDRLKSDVIFLEWCFAKQLNYCEALKNMMALYHQDITQKSIPKSYERL